MAKYFHESTFPNVLKIQIAKRVNAKNKIKIQASFSIGKNKDKKTRPKAKYLYKSIFIK